jgi:hypothetical protein
MKNNCSHSCENQYKKVTVVSPRSQDRNIIYLLSYGSVQHCRPAASVTVSRINPPAVLVQTVPWPSSPFVRATEGKDGVSGLYIRQRTAHVVCLVGYPAVVVLCR